MGLKIPKLNVELASPSLPRKRRLRKGRHYSTEQFVQVGAPLQAAIYFACKASSPWNPPLPYSLSEPVASGHDADRQSEFWKVDTRRMEFLVALQKKKFHPHYCTPIQSAHRCQ